MSDNIFVRRIGKKSEARIREWIKALVSGSYSRHSGALRTTDGSLAYCCLGVICQLADPVGWGYVGGSFGHVMGQNGARNGYLNSETARRYNLSTAGQKKLARLNDSGASFGEIAVFIAEQLGSKLAVQA